MTTTRTTTSELCTLIVLRAPSANRVYTAAAESLSCAEAHWVLGARGLTAHSLRPCTVAGADALAVQVSAEESKAAIPVLQSLSTSLAVFEAVGATTGEAQPGDQQTGDQQTGEMLRPDTLLRPLTPRRPELHPSDLESTLKYSGKTNEQFTAMLVNLAAALSGHRNGLDDGTLSLLDPMCGRGTTLNRALALGLSPVGADIDTKDVDAYRVFLSTWLRTHRYKHHLAHGKLSREGKKLGVRVHAEFARDKAAQKAGQVQTVDVYGCDTADLSHLIRRGSIDVIVADLPYGVQHGARSKGTLQRSPLQVLEAAAPGWRRLMKADGAMALAVNRHTLPHAAAAEALATSGFTVVNHPGSFRHRVDQAIDRDVILAVPTNHPRLEEFHALGAAPSEESEPASDLHVQTLHEQTRTPS